MSCPLPYQHGSFKQVIRLHTVDMYCNYIIIFFKWQSHPYSIFRRLRLASFLSSKFARMKDGLIVRTAIKSEIIVNATTISNTPKTIHFPVQVACGCQNARSKSWRGDQTLMVALRSSHGSGYHRSSSTNWLRTCSLCTADLSSEERHVEFLGYQLPCHMPHAACRPSFPLQGWRSREIVYGRWMGR